MNHKSKWKYLLMICAISITVYLFSSQGDTKRHADSYFDAFIISFDDVAIPTQSPRQKVTPSLDSFNFSSTNQRKDKGKNDTAVEVFWTKQQARKESTRQLCSPKNGAPLVKRMKPYKNIFIDKHNSITFCPVYKSASTSWSKNILSLRGYNSTYLKGRLQKVLRSELSVVANSEASEKSKSTTSFMIVREPIERLISCYRDKYENNSKPYYFEKYGQKMMLLRKTTEDLTHSEKRKYLKQVETFVRNKESPVDEDNPYMNPYGPTFEEFCLFITGSLDDDEHWRPYYQHCSSCAIAYDFVLRFENLEEDSELLIQYLNLTSAIEPRWDNPTHNGITSLQVACEYVSHLDLDLLKRIINKYHIDYLLYNYDVDKYRHCVRNETLNTLL